MILLLLLAATARGKWSGGVLISQKTSIKCLNSTIEEDKLKTLIFHLLSNFRTWGGDENNIATQQIGNERQPLLPSS